MRTIERRGPEVAVGIGIVKRRWAEVLVLSSRPVCIATARILEPRQGVCNLKAQRTHTSTSVLHALRQFRLESVVHRASYGLEKQQRRRVWIDSREGAAVITRAIDGRERAHCSKVSR